ncbi:hypothetical protein K438DRAFT_1775096 [Mycena galopus ATCC 62051]|nr:hypothetical protein K438DRAFT_1775096 [Mycena galopus ATCC 62051]
MIGGDGRATSWAKWRMVEDDRLVTLSSHCQLTLSIHAVNPHCQPTLSTHTVSPRCQLTLSAHAVNSHCQLMLSPHAVNTPCHILSPKHEVTLRLPQALNMQRKPGARKAGNSGNFRIMGTPRPSLDTPGPSKIYSKTLQGKSLERHRLQTKEDLRTELSVMDSESKQRFIHPQNLAADNEWEDVGEDWENSLSVNIDGVMDGSEQIDLSHAGGELHQSIEDDLEEEIVSKWDWRTRLNRTEERNQGFQTQMLEMLKAYMWWCASKEHSDEDTSSSLEVWTITVVDIFNCEKKDTSLDQRGNGVVPALIMSGLIPCAPWKPSVAITVRVLEMYRIAHARCPQFAIQSFVKTLCDLYEFSICYDLYLDLRRNAEKMVLTSLGQDSFAWRLKHACPSCMYRLEGEEKLIFDILVTMDGNNSLKRVLRREKVQSDGDTGTDTMFVVGKSKEHADSKDAGDGYYLDREKVNEWSKHRIAEMLPMEAVEGEEPNPCADRWKNMVEDVTAKMWGIFDETGIFLCLCRHGFVLVICDMLKSGELDLTVLRSKYPLAVMDCLIEHLGQNIGNGYDVGCDFQTTIRKSPPCSSRKAVQFPVPVSIKIRKTLFSGGWEEEVTSFDTFRIWLEEEKEFLLGLKAGSKDQTQTLEMEYVQKLVNLDASRARYVVVAAEARKSQADNASYTPGGTSRAERARRHAKEKMDRDLDTVQELEEKLEISERWTTESPKWMTTVAEIKQKKYQKALDAVELLVVERIFELTKMNQSQTGYKLLEVQSRPWTRPAYRLAMDTHFKIERAREEIARLNIEIRRLVTWIRDEGRFLHDQEASLHSSEGKTEEQAEADLLLAVQMRVYRGQRSRFDDQHMETIRQLAKMKGFTSNISPGRVVELLGDSDEMEEMEVESNGEPEPVQSDSDHSEDEGFEAQDETVSGLLYHVSMISLDDRNLVGADQD